jgi:hypothetical protein
MAIAPAEYRPHPRVGIFLSSLFVLVAGVLVWLGTVLTGDAADAMDGFVRLLFTAMPVRPFAWTLAAVFLLLGIRVAAKIMSKRPTLTISDRGLGLPDGTMVLWPEIASAESVHANTLQVTFRPRPAQSRDPEFSIGWRGRLTKKPPEHRIVVSAFDLGADPSVVAAAIAAASRQIESDAE